MQILTKIKPIRNILSLTQSEYKTYSLKEKNYIWTEKLDGLDFTAYCVDGEFGINYKKKNQKYHNIYIQIVDYFNLKEKLQIFGKNVILQGEIVGQKIKKIKYNLPKYHLYCYGQFNVDKAFSESSENNQDALPAEYQLYLYDIYDLDQDCYLDYDNFINTAKILKIPIVPIITTKGSLTDSIASCLLIAEGISKLSLNSFREGVIIKNKERTLALKVDSNKVKFFSNENDAITEVKNSTVDDIEFTFYSSKNDTMTKSFILNGFEFTLFKLYNITVFTEDNASFTFKKMQFIEYNEVENVLFFIWECILSEYSRYGFYPSEIIKSEPCDD